MPSEQPFAGLEVVEFGQFIAVPFCAQLLSEGGAHVIKVESLAGDPTRQLLPLAPGETRPIELLDDEQVLANRMVHDVDHPAIGPVRMLANPVHLDGNGFVPAPITPAFGSEVRDLLAGAGFSVAEIDSFIADGVTRESIEKK